MIRAVISFFARTGKTEEMKSLAKNCIECMSDTENTPCIPNYYYQIVTRKMFLLPWLVEALSENIISRDYCII